MKLTIESYQKDWPLQFESIKQELFGVLDGYDLQMEHFGSTSVPGLDAKPVIDVLVGIPTMQLLDEVAKKLMHQHKYIYYRSFDSLAPERRLFVRIKDESTIDFPDSFDSLDKIPHDTVHEHRLAHIHIWTFGSKDWIRHLAFRDYLIAHPVVCAQYAALKKSLVTEEYEDGMAYNRGKDEFIKTEEAKALVWYHA